MVLGAMPRCRLNSTKSKIHEINDVGNRKENDAFGWTLNDLFHRNGVYEVVISVSLVTTSLNHNQSLVADLLPLVCS